MSSNIFGYQGVNTPLESLTNGRYNVADYTTLRETVDARLSVLEKEQATPQNVTVTGSLTVTASNTQSGFITAAGAGSFGGSLYAASGISTNSGIIASSLISTGVGIQFPDSSIQTTAAVSLAPGSFTSSNIVVNASGAISSISSGVSLVPLTPGTYTNSTVTVNGSGIISAVSAGSNASAFVNLLITTASSGTTYIPSASTFKNTEIIVNGNNSFGINLLNLTCEDESAFPDGVRYVSITKAAVATGDYTITVSCPANTSGFPYRFYTASGQDIANYLLNTGKSGVTFMIYRNSVGSIKATVIKSLVN
jgi:hypothetical protein